MRVLGQNLEALAQRFRIHDRAGPALPPERFERRERVAPGRPLHLPLQVDLVRDLDPFVGEVPRERLRAGSRGRRTRQEVRRHHARRQDAVAPCNLVEQLVNPLHRGEQRAARGPLHGVPAQGADGDTVRVVESDVGADHFPRFGAGALRVTPHVHMAEQSIRQALRQREPLPPEGQIRDRLVVSVRCAGRSHDLEATVQHQRVNLQPGAAEEIREGHFAQCFARP